MTAREKFAEVRSALRTARKSVLADYDLTEEGLKSLEKEALEEMGEDAEALTAFGKLLVNEKPTFAHKNSQLVGYTRFLTFKED